jgi:beta-N-acetylhexosaminidase
MAAPRAVIFGCAGPTLAEDEAAFLRDSDHWGFILFARNISTPEGTRALVASLRETVGRQAPVFIDEEGGRVSRLQPPHWRRWPDAGEAVARLDDSQAETVMRLRYRLIAADLAAIGIDCNCAPVVDVRFAQTHAVIGMRAYGTSAARVSLLARAAWDGLTAGGVLPVIKHLPGHGRATQDSHLALPVVDAPRADLEAVDFAAIKPLADAPMGMTAHILYTALDPDACATFSPKVIALLRREIGFRGLLMTDDISMGALSEPMGERVQKALAAGCDMVLHCNGDQAEMVAVAAATPKLEGPAASRAGAALAARKPPQPFDAAETLAALRDLGGGPVDA